MPPGRLRDVALCGLALAVMACAAFLQLHSLDLPWLRRLEVAVLDLEVRLRGPLPPGREIVVVMIDDRSVDALGSWPVPREKLAEAVHFLAQARAKVIGVASHHHTAAIVPREIRKSASGVRREIGSILRAGLVD